MTESLTLKCGLSGPQLAVRDSVTWAVNGGRFVAPGLVAERDDLNGALARLQTPAGTPNGALEQLPS